MEQNKKSGIHCIVSGKVQGVFYRVSTKDMADNLNLSGWVRNLPNGDVELQAFGELDKLQDLINWLWDGPPLSVVKDIDLEYIDFQNQVGFKVTH